MLIKVGKFEFTEVWDGVLYKNLSDYPNITDWELRTLTEFAEYENSHGRSCTLECDDARLRSAIENALQNPNINFIGFQVIIILSLFGGIGTGLAIVFYRRSKKIQPVQQPTIELPKPAQHHIERLDEPEILTMTAEIKPVADPVKKD